MFKSGRKQKIKTKVKTHESTVSFSHKWFQNIIAFKPMIFQLFIPLFPIPNWNPESKHYTTFLLQNRRYTYIQICKTWLRFIIQHWCQVWWTRFFKKRSVFHYIMIPYPLPPIPSFLWELLYIWSSPKNETSCSQILWYQFPLFWKTYCLFKHFTFRGFYAFMTLIPKNLR